MSDDEQQAVLSAARSVILGDRWVLGPKVDAFEQAFGDYLGFGTAVGVANGTDAIAIALLSLQVPPGSGVLLAANEGGYAAAACRLVGLTPVVMDVDELTMLPTPRTAEAAMREGVSAIIVTHLHGEATDIRALDEWRAKHGIALIEDCAQAAGARLDGQHVGARADAATFSFYPTKNLAAVGDAGAVVFAAESAAARARSLRQYGWGERYRPELPGGRNSRLDELQAAVLLARLPFLESRNARRRSIAARFKAVCDPATLRYHGRVESTIAHHSVVLSDERDSLGAFLDERGISTAVHYAFLVQDMPGIGLDPSIATPVAARQRDRKLSLPCFAELDEIEVIHVIEALEEWHAAATAPTSR